MRVNPPFDPKMLARRELAIPGRYQLREVSPTPQEPSMWDRFTGWLNDEVQRIWNALFGHVHIGSTASTAIGDVITAVIAIIVLLVVFRMLVSLQIERTARRRTANSALEIRRNAHALYLQACELAQRGEYAIAARVLFLAAVVALDLRGLIRDDASSTVGDVRRRLCTENALLVPPFDDVARAFVTAAYAEAPIGAEEWSTANDGYRTLTRAAPS
jgi:hypothetical protein